MLSMAIHTINKGAASEIETFAMKNCSMLLSSQAATAAAATAGVAKSEAVDPTCMFTCKTCDKKFPSFQALGGHRASHNKIKPAISAAPAPEKTPKSHACPICGQQFLIGQALGGHMRRHRRPSPPAGGGSTVTFEESTENSEGSNSDQKKRKNDDDLALTPFPEKPAVGKRVCLDLLLNFAEGKDKEDHDLEDGEVVEEERDFLKLELRLPSSF